MELLRVAVVLFAVLATFFITSRIIPPIFTNDQKPEPDRQWPQWPETWPKPLPTKTYSPDNWWSLLWTTPTPSYSEATTQNSSIDSATESTSTVWIESQTTTTVAWPQISSTESSNQDELEDFRLPRNVVPKRYMIDLNVSMKTLEYNGTVVIECQALGTTSQITLHENVTMIQWLEVKDLTSGRDIKSGYSFGRFNFLTLHFKQPIPTNNTFIIKIGFLKKLPPREEVYPGVYYSTYINETFISTTFEPNFARSAFPCFDEPALKATFEMRVSVEIEYSVFFNSKEIQKTKDAWWSHYLARDVESTAWKTVKFDPTPIMSTYLVAFTIGHFECKEVFREELKPTVRVCKLAGTSHDLKTPLKVYTEAVDFFADLFELPHEVPKVDVVGLPSHHAAIEQWGLVTIMESLIFVNQSQGPRAIRPLVHVGSHEIAHFYFGNLVTMDWWNAYWIKESMAVYMQVYFTDSQYPLLNGTAQLIKKADKQRPKEAYYNTLAVQPKNVPEDLEAYYKANSDLFYERGAATLRMLHRYLKQKSPRNEDLFLLH